MFKVTKERRVEWPVLIQVPQAGGKVKEHEVTVEFEDPPQSEVDAVYEAGGLDKELMVRVVRGWKAGQFKDDADNDIEFSEDSLKTLLDIAFVRTAFVAAWLQLHNGKAAARKN